MVSSFPFRGMPQYIPFDEKNIKTWRFVREAALEVIGALNIARGKEFVIPSKEITAEERFRLKRYKISRTCWFSRWVQTLCIKML